LSNDAIKVGIVGAGGRMGRNLIQAALEHPAFTLTAAFDRANSEFVGRDVGVIIGSQPQGVEVVSSVAERAKDLDVLIDFTRPEATCEHVSICAEHGVNLVIGTTGFDDAQQALMAENAQKVGIVWAPNMSTSVNVAFRLIAMAAKALGGDDYDIEVLETHHRHKVDAPSGTALRMGEVLADSLGWDFKEASVLSREGITGERPDKTIGFATLRGGDVAGEHTVMFLGDGERLEITHKSNSRKHWAQGALRAALWLNQQSTGLYGMEHVLGFE
jgi:4-hydroxy-tetrahydrodipicolinate reductase